MASIGDPPPVEPSSLDAATVGAEGTGRFYLPALDGVRLLAFAVVWQFHALAGRLPPGGWGWRPAAIYAGSYGVPLFFVLSAYLITRLLRIERERTGRIDLRAYYVRRTLRIWPLYVLVVLVGLALTHHLGQPIRAPAFALATFTANWYHGWVGLPGALGPLWSLSVEEQFYFVWPVVLLFCGDSALRRLCWAMVAAAMVSRGLIMHATHAWIPAFSATTSHLDSLGLGALLALGTFRVGPLRPTAWLAAFLGCLLGMLLVARYFPFASSFAVGTATAIAYGAVPFLCAVLLSLLLEQPRTPFEWPPVVWFGRITYGLYSWHMIPIVLLGAATDGRLAKALLATVVLAMASFTLYERPFLRLKHRFEKVRTRLE